MPKIAPTIEADHPLNHLIPKEWFMESYESRMFDGFRDIDILDNARRMRWNTLLYGPTGPGKTTCVYAYGAERRLPVVYVACNGAVDPATMFVQPTTAEDGRIVLVESDVVGVMRHGGILYLDEVNAMPPRIAMVFHGALDLRRTITLPQKGNEPIPLHPNCQIIASFNPNYQGTKPLNEAFKNRFGIQLPFEYDRAIEEKLVIGIPSLLDLATMLRSAQEQGTIETPVGPNMLLEFEELVRTFSVEFAISNFVNRFEPGERGAVRETINTHFIDRIREEAETWMEDDEDDDETVVAPKPTPKQKGRK